MDYKEKRDILQQIAECVPESAVGEEEKNLLQNFLPLRSYSKLASDKTFLITGGRGAGKTELFRILTSCDGLSHVLSDNDKRRYTNLKNSEFIVGYLETDKKFPARNICSRWIEGKKSEEISAFWSGLLCAVLINRFWEDKKINRLAVQNLGEDLYSLLKDKPGEISGWWEMVYSREEQCESFLNDLDDLLKKRGLCIFITYDELDKICEKHKDLFAFIRNLLKFWFSHNNRFTNIKAKIFLRSDLYNAKALQFADSSKMRAYHLELKWDSLSLYRMLVKRIANADSSIALRYLEDIPGLIKRSEGKLGYMPCDSEEPLRLLVEKMIGKYMGKTPKRGISYSWVPNHIQDANGDVAPRPFLNCFSFAAKETLEHQDDFDKLEGSRLLLPMRLQGALANASKYRVDELTLEEYQWLQNLIDRLKDKTMLMDKREFLSYLEPSFWPKGKRDELPGRSKEEIYEALLTLGIIMETSDNRINVPEIYLYGFGLKRKGGIKRPK